MHPNKGGVNLRDPGRKHGEHIDGIDHGIDHGYRCMQWGIRW